MIEYIISYIMDWKEFSGVIVLSPTAVYDGWSLSHIILSVPNSSDECVMYVTVVYLPFLSRLMTHWAFFRDCWPFRHHLFFLKYLFETLNHFSTVIFPFLTGLQKFFIYSWCKFCQLHALSISLTTLTCLFHSVGEVFWWIKVMYCNVVQVTYLFPVNLVHSVSCLRSTKATKTAYVMLYKCYYFTFHV